MTEQKHFIQRLAPVVCMNCRSMKLSFHGVVPERLEICLTCQNCGMIQTFSFDPKLYNKEVSQVQEINLEPSPGYIG